MSLFSRVLSFHSESSTNTKPQQSRVQPKQVSPVSCKLPTTNPDYNITISLESPPIVLYGNPCESTGSIISGILTLTTNKSIQLENVSLSLLQTMKYTKPFTLPNSTCPQCNSFTTKNELARWDVLTTSTTFPQGKHEYPFSHLIPGSLPPTAKIGSIISATYIKYELIAIAKSTKSSSVRLSIPIPISRSILRGPERNSLRIFPPTDVSATIQLPNVIYPKSTFPIEIKLDNLVSKKRRWRMKKLIWRIEEFTKIKAKTCELHENILHDLQQSYRNKKQTNDRNKQGVGVHTSISLISTPTNQSRTHHHRNRSTEIDQEHTLEPTTSGLIQAHQSFIEDFTDTPTIEEQPPVQPTYQEKHIYLEEIRTVANGDIKSGWKSDFTGKGRIELVVHINISSITSGIPPTIITISSEDSPTTHESLNQANISCDIDDPTLGVHVNHSLILEVVVAEEVMTIPKEVPQTSRTRGATISKTPLTTSISAPASTSSRSRSASTPPTTAIPSSGSIPTGAARVLRMQFKIPITERSGLGIAWDDEVPPTYEDVRTFSPPNYDTSTPYTNTPHVSIVGIGEDLPEEFTL